MARSFDISAEYESSVDEVLRAFSEADYWLARLEASGVDEAKLETLRVGDENGSDGAIDVVTLQFVHSDKLPALIAQFYRGNLCIRREETWGPVTDGTSTASIAGSLKGAPAHVSGSAVLSPTAESGGSRLECRLTVHVRIPLLGGKLEKFVGGQLAQLVSAEQQFTSTWIKDNF